MKGRCLFRVTVPAVVMLCWTGCSWLNEESKNTAIERENIVKPEDRERWQNEAAGEPVKAPEEMAVEQVDQQLYTPPAPAPTLPVMPAGMEMLTSAVPVLSAITESAVRLFQ